MLVHDATVDVVESSPDVLRDFFDSKPGAYRAPPGLPGLSGPLRCGDQLRFLPSAGESSREMPIQLATAAFAAWPRHVVWPQLEARAGELTPLGVHIRNVEFKNELGRVVREGHRMPDEVEAQRAASLAVAFGLSFETQVETIQQILAEAGRTIAIEKLREGFAAVSVQGSFWPVDAFRDFFDPRVRAAEEKEAREAEEARQQAEARSKEEARLATVNTKTLRERGLVGVRFAKWLAPKPGFFPGEIRLPFASPDAPTSLDAGKLIEDGDYYVLLVEESALGARVPEARELVGGCSSDYVPAVTERELEMKVKTAASLSQGQVSWLQDNTRAPRAPRDASGPRFDRMSLKGQLRIRQFREHVEPRVTELFSFGKTGGTGGRLLNELSSAGRDGFALTSRVVAEEITMLVANARTGEQPPSIFGVRQKSKLMEIVELAPVLFNRDELYSEPTFSVVDGVLRAFPWLDTWRAVCAKALEEQPTLRKSDLENILRAHEGLPPGELTTPQRKRVVAIMSSLGVIDRKVGGVWCWVGEGVQS